MTSKKKKGNQKYTQASDLVKQGEIKQALRIIDPKQKGALDMTEEVANTIEGKFPKTKVAETEESPNTYLPEVTNKQMRDTIMSMKGSGGVSHLDAKAIKRIITSRSFEKAGEDILNNLTKAANELARKRQDPKHTEALMITRLIGIRRIPE